MTPQSRKDRVTTRTILLLFAAILALGGGVFNLRDRLNQKAVPTDGVVWRDEALGVRAALVEPDSPAALADVRPGDYLIGISNTGREPFEVIEEAQHVQIYLDQAQDQEALGLPLTLSYWIERRNDLGDTVLREGIADLDRLEIQETHLLRGLYLALIGLIYLGVGIYFLLRQGRAPYVNIFFLICLLGFIAHFYSPTVEMRTHFDKTVDFADVVALNLLAPLLVHFALIYPGQFSLPARRVLVKLTCYGPALLLLGIELILRFDWMRGLLFFPAVKVRSTLNRIEILLFGLSLLTSAVLFIRSFKQARSVVVRQQLKWVMWGMSIAAVTFSIFYLPSFLVIESVASVLEMAALAPLILVPVTFGYSIVRYR
ncbi:MAG: hypothetical protein EBU88_14855, partial [Acidobacteria bacterium]|nr:hypothetical protein [Acidobacteriota bacterium]